ncbi:MAG: DUF3990 domain-containing protein [Anaerocolumna sp.]
MILYHGSIIEVTSPQIIRSEIGRDFGFAFYTTDICEQAVRWAKRKALIENRKSKKNYIATVSQYEWNEKTAYNELHIKAFQGSSMEWLEMVLECRSNISYEHEYDIVIGNIANDNVGETVSYVLQGIMRKEDAIERLKFEKINNQIAFCTNKALTSLKHIGSFIE